ncbi:MAG: hypothetical protein DI637_09725 [Citromicrobium sp.]|nr:MAG: hypothetical protein DI637_09725 [Citromicrobium sp.]
MNEPRAIDGPIYGTSARETYAALFAFVRRPSLVDADTRRDADWWKALGALTALDLLIAALLLGLFWIIEQSGVVLPEVEEFDFSPPVLFLLAVVVAPLCEEPLFRGWLSGNRAALNFAACTVLALVLIGLSRILPDGFDSVAVWGALLILLGAYLHWRRTREANSGVPDWFARNYGLIVYGSSIIFGAVHLTNFNEFSALHPLMVLSQTVGALVLAFTRTRLGLRAAIYQHAAFNAVMFSGEMAFA